VIAEATSRLINARLHTRRIVAVALLVAAIGSLGGVAWVAVSAVAQTSHAIQEKREIVGRLRAVAALKPALMQDEAAGPPSVGSEDFLEGDSEAVARGNLQTRLTEIVSARNANLTSVSNVPELDLNGARYIGIRADLTGTMEAIHDTIFAIESSGPILIRDASIWLSGYEQAAETTQAPEISAQIRIYGAPRPAFTMPGRKAQP
jgi:hypothetical protein